MLPGALDSSTHTAVNDAAQVDQQDTYTRSIDWPKRYKQKKGDLFGMGQSSLITFSGGVPTVTCSTYQTRTEKKRNSFISSCWTLSRLVYDFADHTQSSTWPIHIT